MSRTQRTAPRRPERRDDHRVPLQIFLNEYIDERAHRALATDVSPTGLYVQQVAKPRWFMREHRFVQLEFDLPNTSDTIWARGEIRRDELDTGDLVHGTGIHLVDIARGHARMLRDWVFEYQKQKLHDIVRLMREQRYH